MSLWVPTSVREHAVEGYERGHGDMGGTLVDFPDQLECRQAKGDTSAAFAAVAMTKDEERELREQLARLQQEHRDLDAAISALQHSPGSDLLQVQRLKKRKLYLRDRISHIEDELTPDIIA
jgi:hypothetical protein